MRNLLGFIQLDSIEQLTSSISLHKLLGFEESLEMPHLPKSSGKKNKGLSHGPPQDTLIGALASLTETLLTELKLKRKT